MDYSRANIQFLGPLFGPNCGRREVSLAKLNKINEIILPSCDADYVQNCTG
jgi:hypothetical protein